MFHTKNICRAEPSQRRTVTGYYMALELPVQHLVNHSYIIHILYHIYQLFVTKALEENMAFVKSLLEDL